MLQDHRARDLEHAARVREARGDDLDVRIVLLDRRPERRVPLIHDVGVSVEIEEAELSLAAYGLCEIVGGLWPIA